MFGIPFSKRANPQKIIGKILGRLKKNLIDYPASVGYIRLTDNRGRTQSETKLLEQDSCVYVLANNTRYVDILAFGKNKSWLDVKVTSLLPVDGQNRNTRYQISACNSQRIDLNHFKKYGLLPLTIEIDYATSVRYA